MLATAVAETEHDLSTATSPDKTYFAAARRVPDSEFVYRRDLDGFRLVVYAGAEVREIYAAHDFPGHCIAQIAWSPDSQFLVFTTDSTGGHSPWHSPAFVFSVPDKSFRRMDDAIGSVLNPGKFRFIPPDVAVMGVHDPGAGGDTFHLRWTEVPLAKNVSEMPHVE